MTRTLKALFALTLIALASCGDSSTTTEPNVAPQFSRNRGTPTLLEGQLPYAPPVQQIIGPAGGIIVLRGPDRGGVPTFHSLVVPAGAVKENLLFTMEAGSRQYVDVELKAFKIKSNTKERGEEVGHLGFRKPLYLTLSYAWADRPFNPTRVRIVHVVGNQIQPEKIRTLRWPSHKSVVGEIRHFSKYSAALD
jgi:hypothetical protein